MRIHGTIALEVRLWLGSNFYIGVMGGYEGLVVSRLFAGGALSVVV